MLWGDHVRKYWFEYLVIFLSISLVLSTSRILSPTWDEAKHTFNGVFYLKDNECCVNEETPFSALHAVFLKKYVSETLERDDKWEEIYETEYQDRIIFLSRIFNIISYTLLILFVWLWAKEIFSQKIARYCLVLSTFAPTLLAHSGIATEDIFLTTWAFISFYLFWRFTKKPTYKNIIFVSIAAGICLLTKISAIFLYFCLLISILIFSINQLSKHKDFRKQLLFCIIILAIPLFILNSGYFFQGTFDSLNESQFRSEKLNALKGSFIGKIPLPLPSGFLKNIDYHRSVTKINERSFLFGRFQRRSLPYYFITAFFLKTSSILLFFIFFGIYNFKNENKDRWLTLCLLLFPLVFLLANSFLNKFNSSVRYILPIYPFLIVISGYSFLTRKKNLMKVLLGLFVVVSLLNFPNYLSFFNISSFVIPKEEMLGDSNLDWGQINYVVKKDMDEKNASNYCLGLRAAVTFNHMYSNVGTSHMPYPRRCLLYISKATVKTNSIDIRYYPYLKEKEYELKDIIEVYNITEDNFKNKFVNQWKISTLVLKPDMPPSIEYLKNKESTLDFTTVNTEFGVVDVNEIYGGGLKDHCVIAISEKKIKGQLLVSAEDNLFLYDENEIYLSDTKGTYLKFNEVNATRSRAKYIKAFVCSGNNYFGFNIAYNEI